MKITNKTPIYGSIESEGAFRSVSFTVFKHMKCFSSYSWYAVKSFNVQLLFERSWNFNELGVFIQSCMKNFIKFEDMILIQQNYLQYLRPSTIHLQKLCRVSLLYIFQKQKGFTFLLLNSTWPSSECCTLSLFYFCGRLVCLW